MIKSSEETLIAELSARSFCQSNDEQHARLNAFRILNITPLERPDIALAQSIVRAGAAAAIDIGRNPELWPQLFEKLSNNTSMLLGLRIPDHTRIAVDMPPASSGFVVIDACADLSAWTQRFFTIVQVTSLEEAQFALQSGARALIAKGQESGGLIGEESSFILLQRVAPLAAAHAVPVWCQGGIGLHSAAAAVAGGAFGVVLDNQLALLSDCRLAGETKKLIRAMDGSETLVVHGYQIHKRPGQIDAPTFANAEAVRARFIANDGDALLPLGQDAALAAPLAAAYPNAESLMHGLRVSIAGHIRQAQTLQPLRANSAFAQAHDIRYPIAQGPMTRVSDTAQFAASVAENGALPFLALSLMNADQCRTLMQQTSVLLGDRTWGVGVLGFADGSILDPQLDLIREFKPRVVLLAGGRPTQARSLQELGITTYLHVPSPGLLELFLRDGMRHFVLEGRECGGHVGPRFSFTLWEQQLHILLNCGYADELNILFAGGIHDERSAAMVAALAAPLVALGAKIGVLMGTAYIATHEAVIHGAINDQFQQRSINGGQTVLIETAPGHAVRCLPSQFVQDFNAEKCRLNDTDLPPQDIWLQLEELNIGRLRIATKGIERSETGLIEVDSTQQRERGLYMIGQAIALRDEIISMAQLHRSVSDDAMRYLQTVQAPALERTAPATPIAIVGMDCIFPGSPDLESYWANILAGSDLISEVRAERWNSDLYYSADRTQKGKTLSKWGGFIDASVFDPLAFGIPPQSMAAIEPVQLLSLAIAKRALADAGYGDELRDFDREKTSVIVGAESGMDLANSYAFRNMFTHFLGEIPPELDAVLPGLTEDSFPGVLVNVIAGRIANRLGLGGVNYAVDSACASSLTAVELGVKELRVGSSDMVLAVGADLHNSINDFLMFTSVGALSPRGRCRSFDASADGICLGEGVGVIVLKRLDDAQRDGDRIYAVIDAVAGSSDGKGLGLTAPKKEGQKRALDRAYRQAGVLPADVQLVEAHGTGTTVGDNTELQTLNDIFINGGALPAQTALGSVKSQIGHTKCAAGIAGMIKVAKALHHRVLPPTALIETPNRGYRAQSSPFVLPRQPRPWPLAPQARAAVSAFGFGGANFHAVLSAAPQAPTPASGNPYWSAELFIFRGENLDATNSALSQLGNFLRDSNAVLTLRDLSFSAAQQGDGPVQCTFVARDTTELAEKIQRALQRDRGGDIFYRSTVQGDNADIEALAFLYPGQGSQSPDMLLDLFVTFPALQEFLTVDMQAARALFPPTTYDTEEKQLQQRTLTDTRNAQPALGIVEMAATQLLRQLGITPAMAAGHSYGELVALWSADTMSAETLLRLSRRRGECILAAAGSDPGKMAAVSTDYAHLEQLLCAFPSIALANQNSLQQTVISGPTADIDIALVLLKQNNVAAKAIETACAFHSSVVTGARDSFRDALKTVALSAPKYPVYSNTTTQHHSDDVDTLKDQLASHIVSPVRFVEQIERMYADGARVFVEVGPKRVLGNFLKDILGERPYRCIAIDGGARGGIAALLNAVAQLAVIGEQFDATTLFAGRNAHVLDLQKPQMIPATAWMIDGARAWPVNGKLPAHAGQIMKQPLALNVGLSGGAPRASFDAPADAAVGSFLDNMREMARAQRDVLLTMLGNPVAIAPAVNTARRHTTIIDAERVAADTLEAPPVASAALDIPGTLLRIVSDRTGYPLDMLDVDLDLEADLSIDSIKRIEIIGALSTQLALTERLGADAEADAYIEQLARLKTLRAISASLQEQLAANAPLEMSVTDESTSTPADARSALIDIVSERTGYPADMLDLDLDLEADLSIDSIKRVEIIGALNSRLDLGGQFQMSDDALEKLARLKTLQAILDALVPALVAESTAGEHDNAPRVIDMESASDIPLSRYMLHVMESPEAIVAARDITGKLFVITDDELGIAPALAKRLRARGAEAVLVNFAEDQPLPPQLADIDGLIHLWSLHAEHRVRDVKRFFNLVRQTLMHKARYVMVASGLGGDFGRNVAPKSNDPTTADFGRGAGLAGMIKSIDKEWPDVRAHWVDFDLDEAPEQLAAHLEAELLAENQLTEVGYRAGRRHHRELVESALQPTDFVALDLNAESVVLLTGGARGITAHLAIELAQRFRCRIELIGRTPLSAALESDLTRAAADLPALRKVLIASAQGLTPAAIEKQCAALLAEREMRATFDAIRAAGATVNYTQLDVRDIGAFAAHIEQLYARYGRIDGVVHGAGIIEDKLIRDKSHDSFERVFDTKVRGALMLHKLLRDDVKFVVFFSSVASAFGNRGQVDYASANDVLDKLASSLQERISGRALSVNWGPWAGTGMVSPHLEREYARKGIGLIPLEAGILALMNELAIDRTGEPRQSQVVLMCGTPESFGAKASTSVARRLA